MIIPANGFKSILFKAAPANEQVGGNLIAYIYNTSSSPTGSLLYPVDRQFLKGTLLLSFATFLVLLEAVEEDFDDRAVAAVHPHMVAEATVLEEEEVARRRQKVVEDLLLLLLLLHMAEVVHLEVLIVEKGAVDPGVVVAAGALAAEEALVPAAAARVLAAAE
jgi:hypothetical protein